MDHWTNQSEELTGNMQIICLPRQHTSNNHFIPYIATYVKQGCCAAHTALFGPPQSLILMSIMVIMMVMVVSPENMKVEEEVAKVSGWVRDSPTHTG